MLYLNATDIPPELKSEIQTKMMQRVIRQTAGPFRIQDHMIDITNDVDNVCDWYGVECADGTVARVAWAGNYIRPPLDVRWFPPTTRELALRKVWLRNTFETRLLPRALKYLNMRSITHVYGPQNYKTPIDMRALPGQIEEFHAIDWQFFGSINLLQLPQTLVVLSLISCYIPSVMIDPLLLPPNLEPIHIWNKTLPKIGGIARAVKMGRVKRTNEFRPSVYDGELEKLMERRA